MLALLEFMSHHINTVHYNYCSGHLSFHTKTTRLKTTHNYLAKSSIICFVFLSALFNILNVINQLMKNKKKKTKNRNKYLLNK